MRTAEQITSELSELVERLNTHSSNYSNIRLTMFDITDKEGRIHWQILADATGYLTTHFAAINYYPERNLYCGNCKGRYETHSLDEVKLRIYQKFR